MIDRPRAKALLSNIGLVGADNLVKICFKIKSKPKTDILSI